MSRLKLFSEEYFLLLISTNIIDTLTQFCLKINCFLSALGLHFLLSNIKMLHLELQSITLWWRTFCDCWLSKISLSCQLRHQFLKDHLSLFKKKKNIQFPSFWLTIPENFVYLRIRMFLFGFENSLSCIVINYLLVYFTCSNIPLYLYLLVLEYFV